ncbi:hypothetical protein CHUAL_013543 [Chamberlinius hualienensis]
MDNASDWSGMQTSLVQHSDHGGGCNLNAATGQVFKVGIYGWRKRCLYLFVLLLMIMVIINMALLIWIIKVMDFSMNGMGKLRILDKGIRLEGEAEFLRSLYTSTLESRKNLPLKIESAHNLTLNARSEDGQIINRLFIGDHKVETMAGRFIIKNSNGKVLFSADNDAVQVAAESLKVTGSGGAIFDGSIQTPLVIAEPGHQLRLESPTRSLEMEAPRGIALESVAGDIVASCLTDLRLQSTDGSITMDAEKIVLKNLVEAPVTTKPQNSESVTVYQLCACLNGRLFLAEPKEHCQGDSSICNAECTCKCSFTTAFTGIDGLPDIFMLKEADDTNRNDIKHTVYTLNSMATDVDNKLRMHFPVERLFEEIEKEKQLVETLNEAIEEIEKSTEQLEQHIIDADSGNDRLANIWKEKYESQVRINENLEKLRNSIKEEVEVERTKITSGWTKYPSTYELDQDISEAELHRLIRQLEMVKMNLNSELNDLHWKMDQESSDYHHFNDLCYNYKLEINAAKTHMKHGHHLQKAEKKSAIPSLGHTTPLRRRIKSISAKESLEME